MGQCPYKPIVFLDPVKVLELKPSSNDVNNIKVFPFLNRDDHLMD